MAVVLSIMTFIIFLFSSFVCFNSTIENLLTDVVFLILKLP